MAFDFSKITSAESSQRGSYIKPGKYVLKVKKFQIKTGFKGTSAIHEFEVTSANKTENVEPSAVGTTVSYVVPLDKTHGPANVKALVEGLTGKNGEFFKSKEGEKMIAALYSEKNPAANELVGCEANSTTTQKGNPFTSLIWTHIAA